MLKEFKEFIARGNIIDLAIGVVIGGAFQKIVTSLVEDMIMPAISVITGKVDFSELVITIGDASIKYGNFITAIVDFLIIAFCIFIMCRYINKLHDVREGKIVIKKDGKKIKIEKEEKKEKELEEPKEPETKICPFCLTEIKYKAKRCPNCTSNLEENEE